LYDAIFMPPLLVSGVIGAKEPTKVSLWLVL
jgi:hypothetical protein